ncbi:MAG: ATP-binding protein [Bacteroidales bacterium]|nr:ATP-binding protein [Bacteroidales bacterium]
MKRKYTIKTYVIGAVLLVGLTLLLLSIISPRSLTNASFEAKRAEFFLGRRMKQLEGYIARALEGDSDEWLDLGKVPEDMVLYRYVDDSLQSWCHQFTVDNDDIHRRYMVEKLINPRLNFESPLLNVTDEVGFYNFGPKWYLAESRTVDGVRVIAGLEIMDTRKSSSLNGSNPHLHIGNRFNIRPLSDSEGSAVRVGGVPQFKLIRETLVTSTDFRLFSPFLYAGNVFPSLGSVFVLNALIFILALFVYLYRDNIFRRIRRRSLMLALAVMDILAIAAIVAYAFLTFRSIIVNSNICLELYKLDDVTKYSFLVYASFIIMLMSVPMLLQMLRPAITRTTGRHFNAFSLKNRVRLSVLLSLGIVLTAAVNGFYKERNKLTVWADRLSVDRDIALEVQLRMVEGQLAEDAFISTLSQLDNAVSAIENRITDTYFSRIAQDYDVTVYLLRTIPDMQFYRSRVEGAEKISNQSRFVFVNSAGRPRYDGIFFYYRQDFGLTRLLVEVEEKTAKTDRGYASIFNLTKPGKVSIPSNYSYAKYKGGRLQSFKGDYAYPMVLGRESSDEKYLHVVTVVNDDEAMVISRPKEAIYNYLIALVFIALVIFLLLSVFTIHRKTLHFEERHFYKARINAALMAGLILTMVVISSVSVLFVYKRNEANMSSIMSDRINSIQTLMNSRIRGVYSSNALMSPEVRSLLDIVGEDTGSDITLYRPDGRVMMSTFPEVFSRRIMGGRINDEAFRNIYYQSKRYYIHKEVVEGKHFYGMYAPLFSDNGQVIAIICCPYISQNYDFRKDAVTHLMAILTVFLILLLVVRILSMAVVERMFKPLSEMGRKMSAANIDALEHIKYTNNDEILSLVESYNRMVDDLSESTRQLAQAERDKAWSGMARQVAHEIKNPLTPMKLQLQRIIRLKQKNDPGWQDKFDEVAKVLLDHIDILTDTANEFSTFAKLYTEEHTKISLDTVLQEEIAMFDNKENISFDYFGLEGAVVMGPKPQLTRVFVNLINNSVQALGDTPDGKISISLRNSVEDGFYDIVFEDNGPGVAGENVNKLFTPNFTTKNGGSGLGLAISRSILERCGAKITYSKSFTLSGACFTISYPK